MELKTAVDEVLQKIGRNMVLFQQLEGLLKHVVSRSSLSGYASELEKKKVRHVESTYRQTLGQLVGQYVEGHLGPEPEDFASHPEEVTEPYISFNIRMGFDEEFYEETKDALAKLVFDRNQLIHDLLPLFNTRSIESCEKLGQKLDTQSKKIRFAIKHVQSIAKAMQEGAKDIASFLQSPEGKEWIRENNP